MKESKIITVTKRVTSSFLEALPPQVITSDCYIYAVVDRKEEYDYPNEKFGTQVRIDPAIFHWKSKTITVHIPLNINYGIKNIDQLDQFWYESIQAAFIIFMKSCLS
tara:strand:+ start:244 stop:564 length:321 start_codon:yes stop_codon:yes gene_type:complete